MSAASSAAAPVVDGEADTPGEGWAAAGAELGGGELCTSGDELLEVAEDGVAPLLLVAPAPDDGTAVLEQAAPPSTTRPAPAATPRASRSRLLSRCRFTIRTPSMSELAAVGARCAT
jgi:hypothetical protein